MKWVANTILAAVLLTIVGCGSDDNKSAPAQPVPARWGELQAKADLYRSLLVQGEHGWFTDDCDSLLWNGLGSAIGLEIDIKAARDENDDWFRTPRMDCYDTGRSKSTISKDMLLGLAWHGYHRADRELLERVLRRGRDRGYFMGKGPVSRVYMTPSLQATFAEALVALGGKKYEPEFWYPQAYPAGNRGFEAHLQVLNILLRHKTMGGISDAAKDRLADHYNRNPGNALFSFAFDLFHGGGFHRAVAILLDDHRFPAERLPTSADRCEPWLWQREMTDRGWQPCPERGRNHHGVDLLFVYSLIEEQNQ